VTFWPKVKLGEIASVQMGQSPPGETYNSTGIGLPFFQGKAEFGDEHPVAIKWCSQPTRIAEAGDILLSVRAPVGPTNFAAQRCCIGRGLAAIRTKTERSDQYFLHYFLRRFEEDIAARGVGSTFAAINRKDIESLELPLPPLAKQQRIVKLLDEAEELRKLRARADRRTADLIPALFHEMFGDPITNPRNWGLSSLAEVGKLDRGRSKHRPRDEPSLYGGRYPFIQTGDVANANGIVSTFTQTYSEKGLAQSRIWPAGTLCITIAANIGKTAVLGFPACFPDSLVGFVPSEKVVVEYVRQWLVTMESRLEEDAPQAAQKNINLKILNALKIPVPPLSLQEEFARRVAEIRALQAGQAESRQHLDDLFQSMLHRAFNGELYPARSRTAAPAGGR